MARVYLCNKCGKRMGLVDKQEKFTLTRLLGYGMDEYDGESLELDLCCDCMKKLIQSCVIFPVVSVGNESED